MSHGGNLFTLYGPAVTFFAEGMNLETLLPVHNDVQITYKVMSEKQEYSQLSGHKCK